MSSKGMDSGFVSFMVVLIFIAVTSGTSEKKKTDKAPPAAGAKVMPPIEPE